MIRAIAFLLAGLVLLVACAVSLVMTTRFVRSSAVAPGIVVALNAGGSHPQIAFVTAAGQHVSYPQGGLVFGSKVGDRVEVRYRAGQPQESATLDRFASIWALTILLALLGAGFTYGGVSSLPSRNHSPGAA